MVCQLWQYYAMDMEPESIRAQRRHQHRATYKAVRFLGDVRTMSRERDLFVRGTRYATQKEK